MDCRLFVNSKIAWDFGLQARLRIMWFGHHRISSLLFADNVFLLKLQLHLSSLQRVWVWSDCDENQHLQIWAHGVMIFPLQVSGVSFRTVVKKELNQKTKLSIYPIYVPTLINGHEIWIMTKWTRSWIHPLGYSNQNKGLSTHLDIHNSDVSSVSRATVSSC